ncbi:IncF plasmid conjugative transfer pilus assembly protein TraK [Candidatus Burkholderia pumila]|uniref:IncF plasmid conjugative transfer pilus assembly protein TraK n=1 Tax=Candidatus Burkholderia pumila TaxID=1090375 RepID=A0ABR5HPJ4_9BURK|nr:IncF plasmid conjugative transfer pilus assembly protein TraK [Candidatus Burkholderia pumila]
MNPDIARNERDGPAATGEIPQAVSSSPSVPSLCCCSRSSSCCAIPPILGRLKFVTATKSVPARGDYLISDISDYIVDLQATTIPETVDHNNATILKMTDPDSYPTIKPMLDAAAIRIKRERITTIFVKRTKSIDHPNNRVIITGTFKTFIGDKLVDSEDRSLLTVASTELAGRAIKKVIHTGNATGTETLFVVDDQGATYQLLLQPRHVPSANIIVPTTGDRAGRGSVLRTAATSSAYQSAIKDLIFEMATAQTDPGADPPSSAVPVNQEVPLWKEARLVFLQTKFLETPFVGEQYTLTNVSGADMVIAEQKLYRPGVVAVEQQTLASHLATARAFSLSGSGPAMSDRHDSSALAGSNDRIKSHQRAMLVVHDRHSGSDRRGFLPHG